MPKNNIHLSSSLKQPNGRPLLNAPHFTVDDLLTETRPKPNAATVNEEARHQTLRVPFLYDKLPQLDVPLQRPKTVPFELPELPERESQFEYRLRAEPKSKDDWNDLPELPRWNLPQQLAAIPAVYDEMEKENKELQITDCESHASEPQIKPVEDTSAVPLTPNSQPATDSPLSAPHSPLLQAVGLAKSYYKKKLRIAVLKGVDFAVQKSEFVSIVGQSGSGKSTLLHLLGTLDNPEYGEIHFEGQRIDNLPTAKRDKLRNRSIGFIFQFYHLLPELTTLENVLSPLMIRDGFFKYFCFRRRYIERAKDLLEQVGLSHRLKHKPCELSGGEMQRAAIARALIAEPKILLADEPTGNLDSVSAKEIITLLQTLKAEKNLTVVMVTHDNLVAAVADRIVRIADGVINN
ncbi:MAG: ABC transporter ATP-binding protein [Planctomycetaceae bacterium]|jgi:lipoprotein-releasing system ATP-binding protein|nr:ABC transporter ATP-binding protein [Planctomycetaceae bacterium]